MPVYTIVTANGKPAVLLNINRQPDSNTVQVARRRCTTKSSSIRKTLPPGVHIEPVLRSVRHRQRIHQERARRHPDRADAGVHHLVLFLRDWGTSLVAGLVIPATIAGHVHRAASCMGESFNLMTLGGLAAAVGLVIDDAIVVVENIVLHRDCGQVAAGSHPQRDARNPVPLVGSTITPIVVFLPLIFDHRRHRSFLPRAGGDDGRRRCSLRWRWR